MASTDTAKVLKSAWKIIPQFQSNDVKRSIDFYVNQLHFDLGGVHPEETESPVPSMCSVAVGKRSDANLYIFQTQESQLQTSNAMIALGTEELDQYYSILLQEGQVKISEPIENKPWGYRQFQIQDPDGNRIQFFKFLEGGNPGTS